MVLGSPVSSDAPLESRSDAATQTTTTHSDPSGRDGPFDSSSGSDGAAAGMMNEDFALTGVESGRLPASASTESRAVVPASSGGDPPFRRRRCGRRGHRWSYAAIPGVGWRARGRLADDREIFTTGGRVVWG